MKRAIQLVVAILALLAVELSSPDVTIGAVLEIDAASEAKPEGYTLSAAYPNPFNPSTAFTLTIQERQRVQVTIFNVLGHPVTELFDGVMQAGETRTFTFEASDLPSGIYFYRVTGERFTEARQITLIK